MKAILCLIPICLSSCVAIPPVISTYSSPPGVFVGIPIIPVEIGVQLRESTIQSMRRAQAMPGEPVKVGIRGRVR